MSNLKDLFGPLDEKYCLYFYYISVFGFALMVFTIISGLWIGLSKKLGGEHYLQMVSWCLVYFIWYFQNRLLYNMCVRSV